MVRPQLVILIDVLKSFQLRFADRQKTLEAGTEAAVIFVLLEPEQEAKPAAFAS